MAITSLSLFCLGLAACSFGGCDDRPGAPRVERQHVHAQPPASGVVSVTVSPSPDDAFIWAHQGGIGVDGSTSHVEITAVAEHVGFWSSTG
jgi:hypothetical protein